MQVVRKLLTLIRICGVVALGLAVYAWFHPAAVKRWVGVNETVAAPAPAPAPSAKQAPPGGPKTGATPDEAALTEQPTVSAMPSLPAIPAMPVLPPPSSAQRAVAHWLGTRFHVAPGAIAPLVVEADKLTREYKLSPNLLIAVMAIESNFHPYIQSEAGAQGLMQVMPVIHAKRYEKFGGKSSFMDPIVSLRVGAEILRDCVKLKGGSETEALRFYFGGGEASDTYIEKVRAEQHKLNLVAAGVRVPTN